MSFLSGITGASVAPSIASPVKPTGSFLSGVSLPTAAASSRASNIANVSAQATASRNASNSANSFGGIALNTLKGLWPASGIPEQFEQGVAQSNDQTPGAEGTLGRVSGIATALSAPLAPIFNPLGRVINATGQALSNTPGAKAYGAKYANQPDSQKPLAERVAGDVANVVNIAGTVLGGYDAAHALFTPKVKGGFLETTTTPEPPDGKGGPPPPGTASAAVKIKTPAEAHAEYAKSQGYEPYTPNDKLPVIQAGPKADNGLPTIQTEVPKARGVKGDLTVHPITEETGKSPAPLARVTPVKEPAEPTRTMAESTGSKPLTPYSPEGKGSGEYKPLAPVESGGKVRTPTLSSKVMSGLDTEEVKDLPGYNKANWDEQRSFAKDVLANDPEKATRIAMTEEAPPSHILASAVFKEVEDKALAEGDGVMINRLAQSPIALERTRMGQEIGYLNQRSDLSPVDKIQEVAKAREAAPETKNTPKRLSREAPKLQRAIRDATPTKDDLASFIKSLECGY